MNHETGLQKSGNFMHHIIGMLLYFVRRLRIKADTRIDIVLQTKGLALVAEIPDQGIKIIQFVVKGNAEFLGKKVSHFIKAFQTAIFVNYSFNKAIMGVEYGAHMQWFRGSGTMRPLSGLEFLSLGNFFTTQNSLCTYIFSI